MVVLACVCLVLVIAAGGLIYRAARSGHLPPIITVALCGTLLVAGNVAIQAIRGPSARDVTFSLEFSERETPAPLTQHDIGAILGKGYTITSASAFRATTSGGNRVVKVVQLRVPCNESDEDISVKLERMPGVRRVQIMGISRE